MFLFKELLRRNADQCLRDMIQLVFMRLPQFSASISIDGDQNLTSETLSLKKKTSLGKRDKQSSRKESNSSQGDYYLLVNILLKRLCY